MTQRTKLEQAWVRMQQIRAEVAKGLSVEQALRNTGNNKSFYYHWRNRTEPGKEQPAATTATPARKPLPAHTPAKPAPSPLNYCPHCGKNLRAVNIALNMNHE